MSGTEFMDAIEPGRKLGPYELVREIGRGGMGIVYKAFESSLNRTVALKVLPDHLAASPGFIERFTREAQSAAALHHPGIVTIYTVGKQDKTHFIAMEFVNGATLAEVLETGGPLPVPRALEIAAEICEALSEAHEKKIIHRDIKPHNIMLDEKNRVKMTDFGLAKAVNDQTLTTAGFILGTPTHMAPEQCNGLPADHRSDIYSAGVVLYEMLTGKPPYTGETPLSLMRQIADMPFPNIRETLPDAPEDVVRIIETFVAKRPEDRYQSSREAAADLRAAIGGAPVAAKVAPKTPVTPAHHEPTVLVETLPAYLQARRSVRRAMIIGAVLALTFVLVLWGSLRIRRALVNDAGATTAPIEWESPEVSTYRSPFDETAPEREDATEPAAAVVPEPMAPADTSTDASSLPPEFQDRIRTGDEPGPEVEPAQSSSEPVPATTSPQPTYTPPVQETETTVQKINEVLKEVDQVLGGSEGGGSNKGKGKGKKK